MTKRISRFKKQNSVFYSLVTLALAVGTSCVANDKAVGDSTTGAFKYREVYLPEGKGEKAREQGLNTLDFDWGIWGHNLERAIPEEHAMNIYAKVNGNTNKKQYCFSSNHLYGYIEEYIDSHYDADEYARFAILPKDNDIVCVCERCVAAGNTRHDASPAVNKLIRRLSERFPGQRFYTSDYRTTSSIPTDTMPGNSGVLISAMNYPLKTTETFEEQKFLSRIQKWNPVIDRVIVWDYINNFDDYFTPYPIFGVMQRRLQAYRDNEVTGVFLNGSGTDLSAMSDIKTAVLAELTRDPDIDWREVLQEKATALYPVTGQLIADFMLLQEDMVAKSGVTLPMYDGVEKALKTYLPEKEFVAFHDTLLTLRPTVKGPERESLDSLLSMLALPRLEIKRINGDPENSEGLLNDLKYLASKEVIGYNEAGWSIEDYIEDYNYLLRNYRETEGKNKLKGEKLVALTPLDADYSNISILTDGMLGIPTNYHSGLLINSPQDYTQIAIPNKGGIKKVKVWLAYDPPYRVFLPESVTLTANGKKIGSVEPKYPGNESGHVPVEFDIPSNTTGTFTLTLHKEPEKHSMAIEEIEAF